MNESNAHKEIMLAISELKTGQELTNLKLGAIDQHLATLNGKVATQEGKIGSMQIRDARADGKREGSRTVIVAAWSVASAILCSIGVVLLEHYFR